LAGIVGILLLYRGLDLLWFNSLPDTAELGGLPQLYEGMFCLWISFIFLAFAFYKLLRKLNVILFD